MDRDSSDNSKGLEWENLSTLYSAVPVNNIQEQQAGIFMNVNNLYESMNVGLHLGRIVHDESGGSTISSLPVSSSSNSATKRSRALYQYRPSPCCQVEGCNLDLTAAKDYHRRHRICESHSKSPKVVVAGMERRFCQQCSRFHDLSEFDDKKRSCRRRLSDHNARRRRLPAESIQLGAAAGLSSLLYGHRPHGNLVFKDLPFSVSNSTSWENASTSNSMLKQADRSSFGMPCFSSDDQIPYSISSVRSSSNPQVLDQCFHARPAHNSPLSSDLPSSHSFLSSNSWSMNGAGSNSMEYGNYNQENQLQITHQHWASVQSNNNFAQEQGPMPSASTVNSITHLQEFQLFNNPFESGCYYSSQRNDL